MKVSLSKDRAASDDVVARLIEDWNRERPDLDLGGMEVVGRILNLGRRLEARAIHVLKRFGLDYSEFDVLATLRRSGSPFRLTPTGLVHAVLITAGAMTACLDRLEKRDLVARERDMLDRRKYWVVLTPDGKRLVDSAIADRFLEAEVALSGLNDSERRQLVVLLARLMVTVPA